MTLNPLSALLLVTGDADLTPPPAPGALMVTNEGNEQVSLAWDASPDAAGYNVYRSPLSGGGYVKVNSDPLADTNFSDSGMRNGQDYYYIVTALVAAGNESAPSNEVTALPHYAIGWANLQWPPSMSHTISVIDRTDNAYGQVWIYGATNQPGQTPTLFAQLGFGPNGSDPANNPDWVWVDASFNVDAGNNDEFVASLQMKEYIGARH